MNRLLALTILCFACSSKVDETDAGSTDGTGGTEPEPFFFTMDTPTEGGFTQAETLSATGTVSGDEVRVSVNGQAAGLDGEAWSGTAAAADRPWLDSPVFPLLAEGTDAHGNWGRGRATFAVGDTVDPGLLIEDALVVRLTDHGLGSFGPLIDSLIAETDLDTLLVSEDPVTTILGGDVYVTAASFGTVDLDLDFQTEGLAYDVSVSPLDATLLLDFGWFNTDGDISVSEINVSGTIRVSLEGTELSLTPQGTAVEIVDLSIFGFNDPTGIVDGLVNTFLSDTIAGLIEEQVVAVADDLLGLVDELTNLEFSGIALDTTLASVRHDEQGLTIFADTALSLTEGALPGDRLSNPERMPSVSGQTSGDGVLYGFGLFLDDDLLSALGAGLVGSGLLDQEIGGDLGGFTLDTTLLGNTVAGFETLGPGKPVTLRTRPTLPLMGTVGAAAPEAGRLHIGGLEIAFEVEGEVVMTVVLDAIAGLGLGSAEELLEVDVVETQLTLLSTTLGSSPEEVEEGLGTLLDIAIPLLVGDALGDALDLSTLPVELLPVGSGPFQDRAALYLDVGDVTDLGR